MRDLDDKSRHVANNIDSAVKALARQMDELLDISRLDAGVVEVHPATFSLADLLCRLQLELDASAAGKHVSISVECPSDAYTRSDPVLLERILRNLLTNAITHNSDCDITVSAIRDAAGWIVSVEDNGCGIPAEERDKIFEEFYQASNPHRDRSKGLGLGLSIVQRLTSLLRVPLHFQSEPGRGTRFSLELPAAPQPGELAVQDSGTEDLSGLAVLVVDDDHQVLDGMKALLEMQGCRVQVADNMGDALSLATAHQPDLALVDFRLRDGQSGFHTIERLRRVYPDLPAVIVSGDTTPERLQQASAAGIPFLSKPVLAAPLRQAIGDVIRRGSCDLE
jgi:CheY-like chemotaxis protein/two-component sensor histidine kinase